jgi:hypothetical protein
VDGIEANPLAMPDMAVLGARNLVNPQLSTKTAVAGSNEVRDRCYSGLGQRRVLAFDAYIANVGTAHLNVGRKDSHPGVWTISPGFGDLRFEGWTRFFLKDASGATVAFGHKSSFCMIDLHNQTPGAPQGGFTCQNQGVSAGWTDIYNRSLPCQFIDVTDVPAGTYTLRIETNFTRQLPDFDVTNNFAELEVTLP